MTKQTELEIEKEVEENVTNYPLFEDSKRVTKNTPFVFLNMACQKQLKKEGKTTAPANLAYVVMLFNDDRDELKRLLTEAGYQVDGIRERI